MSAPTAVIVSFRLGGSDGVSVEARKWEWALGALGFETRRVAGEFVDGLRPDDVWVPYLAIEPVDGARAEPDVLAAALAGADLVVVENLCSLPLNLDAASSAAAVLDAHQGRVLFHHHDLPWERPNLAQAAGIPPRRPNSLHITINDIARRALRDRGIEAHTIRNAFDLAPRIGDRDATRDAFGFVTDDVVVLQPTRAIPRKEVARGVAFVAELAPLVEPGDARYWLTGPAEDGFGSELDRILAAADVRVTRGRAEQPQDAYAAADVVVFPSSWEGFGNPVIEATVADRPVAVAHYPVLDELRDLGLQLFSIEHPDAVASWLASPVESVRASNRACLEQHFDLADLPARIEAALATVGWQGW
jgi:glycosyltransferase involved in cell wall biosynthesis